MKTVEKLLQTFPKGHAHVDSKIPKGKQGTVTEAAMIQAQLLEKSHSSNRLRWQRMFLGSAVA